ncbi:hypothetical protein [Streptomyces spongiae]|uniref:HIT domain-containing protein n=1 Tax=Streptomyces spongiae TaxID=565072 RepID=A0A5N8XTQ2_9ACTN|nr:hypothetical protein [Streptomyces spongiae]MPY62005.1 hypothetical protein [Streptomyces spongiae]
MPRYPTVPVDTAEYAARLQSDNRDGRCFICEIVRGERGPDDLVVHRDDVCVIFPPVPQRLYGYMLLAPVEHHTRVVDDFSEAEYLEL